MPTNIFNQDDASLEEILLALENDEYLPNREQYRSAVKNYQNYFIPALSDENNAHRIFTMPTQNNSQSIPIFLSEEVYALFEKNYLKEYGYLDKLENNGQVLGLKRVTGQELFDLLPKTSLPAFLVLFSESEGFLINFKLVQSFIECFQEAQAEIDLETLLDKEADSDLPEGEIERKINLGQKFRKLFEIREWIVLISQTTANKLLKGEVSRDDFDLDRSGDQRIVIFSAPQIFEDFKNMTGQSQVRFHTIKVESNRIFRSNLSKYRIIIIDPRPPQAVRVSREDFALLNRLAAAVEIEKTFANISKFRSGYGKDYIEVKQFRKYILPLDRRLTEPNLPKFDSPVLLTEASSGQRYVPVFTAEDNFEVFRLHYAEKYDLSEINLIEPYVIDGQRLFEILSRPEAPLIIFNPDSPIGAIEGESNFALKVYCA